MVSIHRVPVNVLLIISVVYLTFRFKRGSGVRLKLTKQMAIARTVFIVMRMPKERHLSYCSPK